MDHRRFSCHSRWVYYLHLAYFFIGGGGGVRVDDDVCLGCDLCFDSGFAAGIYTTNSAEACLHCALNGQADIIVVEDRKQLEKILSIKDQIPTLKAIVQYTGKPHVEGVITVSWLMQHLFFLSISFSSFEEKPQKKVVYAVHYLYLLIFPVVSIDAFG